MMARGKRTTPTILASAEAPENRHYLVIGPNCWGRDRKLRKAMDNARSNHPWGTEAKYIAFLINEKASIRADLTVHVLPPEGEDEVMIQIAEFNF